ncbi:MAG: T9SS type A sorting domain-containing protein [Saprospiraceae bacterium]|nr:T9SS type A sorting domain-containing protein [Saprospiraceae bacterium]
MKRLLPLFLLLFLITAAQAQFDLGPTPVMTQFGPDENDIHGEAKLTYNGSTPLTLRWNIINISSPKEWTAYVCLGIACYPPGQYTGLTTIQPGETIAIQGHFFTNLFCGEGSFDVTFTDESINQVVATGTFQFECMASSTSNPTSANAVSIFPNPAVTWFSLSENIQASRVEVYNIIGKQIAQYSYQSSGRYDISNLAGGMYLVRVIDKQGRVVTTKRLTKNTP